MTIPVSTQINILTSRFGQVAIEESDMVLFNDGLLGFKELKKFVFLDDPTDDIFAWLQSCESPEIAFPILEPELFQDNFKVELAKSDLEPLKLQSAMDAKFFCVVTIPEDPTLMTANLKAPLVVNLKTKCARQCVLQDNSLAIREPIFLKLQQRFVQNPARRTKDEISKAGVLIPIPRRNPDPQI